MDKVDKSAINIAWSTNLQRFQKSRLFTTRERENSARLKRNTIAFLVRIRSARWTLQYSLQKIWRDRTPKLNSKFKRKTRRTLTPKFTEKYQTKFTNSKACSKSMNNNVNWNTIWISKENQIYINTTLSHYELKEKPIFSYSHNG